MRRRIFLALAAGVLLSGGAAAARAQGQTDAQADRVSVEELKRLLAAGGPVLVLDVRAHAESVIKGARQIPLDQLASRVGELPRGPEIVTYCA